MLLLGREHINKVGHKHFAEALECLEVRQIGLVSLAHEDDGVGIEADLGELGLSQLLLLANIAVFSGQESEQVLK